MIWLAAEFNQLATPCFEYFVKGGFEVFQQFRRKCLATIFSHKDELQVDWLSAKYLQFQGARRPVFPPHCTEIFAARRAACTDRPATSRPNSRHTYLKSRAWCYEMARYYGRSKFHRFILRRNVPRAATFTKTSGYHKPNSSA